MLDPNLRSQREESWQSRRPMTQNQCQDHKGIHSRMGYGSRVSGPSGIATESPAHHNPIFRKTWFWGSPYMQGVSYVHENGMDVGK